MKLSIITAVLNDAAHIAETVRSVLEQDGETEYIVIDGGSTDGTLEALSPYCGRLTVVSEPDDGIYQAMNKGIRRSTGDVIGIINSGDRYLAGAFDRVRSVYAHPENAGKIFWGDVEYEICGRVKGFRKSHRYIGAFAPHPSMFVPRRIYDRIGLYDETLRLMGDYDFMYRAVNHEGIGYVYCPEIIAWYRAGGASDRDVARCLREELQVKLRYGASPLIHLPLYWLKLLKNRKRIKCIN